MMHNALGDCVFVELLDTLLSLRLSIALHFLYS
jgi:hypothetical protein